MAAPVPPPPDPAVGRWERWFDRLVFALARLAWTPSGRGRARGVLRVFQLAERVTERGRSIRQMRPGGVLRYEVVPLSGRALPLPGQRAVRPGERIVSIHWDNQAITALAASAPSTQALTWRLARAATKDFYALAALARNGTLPPDVRVVWAETVVYPVLARFGFATRPAARTPRTAFERLFQLGMMAIYGRDGLARLDGRWQTHLCLGEAWISLEELQARVRR